MTRQHVWGPRLNDRPGFRCVDCYQIASSEHQDTPCEADAETEQPNGIRNTTDLARVYGHKLDQVKELSETSCPGCDFDEAEGGLVSHCDDCCRRIVKSLWAMAHQTEQAHHDATIKAYYLSLLPKIREVAWFAGYAIGVHGSLVRDFDLIAAPWVATPLTGERLAHSIKDAVGGKILPAFSMVPGDTENKNPGKKPHGRMAWTILLSEGDNAKFIDLSVMPLVEIAQ